MSNFLDQFIPANPAQVMDRREIWRGARDGTLARPDVDTSEADRMADPSIRRGVAGFLLGDNDPNTMNVGEKIGTALNTGGESLTFGLVGDEAAAAADAAIGRGTYDERLQKYRGDEQQFADENPVAYTGALLAPALLPAGAGARAVAAAPSLAGKVVTSGLMGGAGGGLYGFMEGEGNAASRVDDGISTATFGGAVGAAAPVVARIAGALVRGAEGRRATRALRDAAPDLDGLRARAQAAYARADSAAPIPRTAFANAAEEIADNTRALGRNPKITPRSQAVMDEVMSEANLQRGEGIGFRDLEILRRQAANPAGLFSDPGEQAVGIAIRDGIDDFISRSSDEMGEAAQEARALWRQLRTTELLDEAFEKAGRQASGFENGIRIQFRNILNSNKGKSLPPDVKNAMEAVVNGTPGGNLLRRIGRAMSPGQGQQTNMLGFGLSTGAGATLGGMTGIPGGSALGAMVPGVIGYAAQRGAERSTVNAAEIARALAASGANLPVPTAAKINPNVLRAALAGAAPIGMATTAGPQ